jgi:hypothetical protein
VTRKQWIAAKDLRNGETLSVVTGDAQLESVEVQQRSPGEGFTTYNFEVENTHTYFVLPPGSRSSAAGLWVHNNGCGMESQKPGADPEAPLTERAARREAFRRNDVSTTEANNFERVEVYGKNPNLRGPKGEPGEVIKTKDVHGKEVEIQHHKHGHTFKDVTPPETEGPHYHGPEGEHIFHEPKPVPKTKN